MKWQVGTVEDLLRLGVNKLTILDWLQQGMGMFAAAVRVAWLVLIILLAATDSLVFEWFWWVLPPLVFAAVDVKRVMVVPHRTKRDVFVAAILLPQEAFAWMRAAWFFAGWTAALRTALTGSRKDRWELQYQAETSGRR